MNFWEGKKVLITGHTGFKGSWLSLWLQGLGAQIIGFSLPPDRPSLFALGRVAEGMFSIFGDIRNLDQFQQCLASCQPEILIHMAAQAFVRVSYGNPVDTFSTNVMGTVNVLEAARHVDSIKVIINVTSENREWVRGYRETDALGGHDPYSCSKGCAELVGTTFYRSFLHKKGVAMASVRAGNVIGGGDWGSDRLIPDLVRSFIRKKQVVIRYPDAVRPWQHVCEPLRGYLRLIESLWEKGEEFSGAWNFGPGAEDAQPVWWIADYLCSHWGETASWRQDEKTQPHETGCLKLDCSKARNRLGWRPKLDLATALDWTIEWHRAYEAGVDMRATTDKQIDLYQSICEEG